LTDAAADNFLHAFEHVAICSDGWAAGWYRLDIRLGDDIKSVRHPALYPDFGDGYWEQQRIGLTRLFNPARRSISGVLLLRRPAKSLALSLGSTRGECTTRSFQIVRLNRAHALLRLMAGIAWDRKSALQGLAQARSLWRGRARQFGAWLYSLYCGRPDFDDGFAYRAWADARRGVAAVQQDAATAKPDALMSVIVPVYNTPARWLIACLESVLSQTYPHWELCIADDASVSEETRRVLAGYPERDQRIKLIRSERNRHISAASNLALSMAQGEFVVLLDHDDELDPQALQALASAAASHPSWDVIYTDEDRIGLDGKKTEPYFKPDFSPELLEGQNCIGHLAAYRRALVKRLGGFREGLEGSQDWDLALRACDAAGADGVGHVPRVLYHWRMSDASTAGDVTAKPYAAIAARRAIQEHLVRSGEPGACVQEIARIPGSFRITRPLESGTAVSVIVEGSTSAAAISHTLAALDEMECGAIADIWVIEEAGGGEGFQVRRAYGRNDPGDKESASTQASFSDASDFAVHRALGDVLVFLRAGTSPLRADSISDLVSRVMRSAIGAAGGKVFNNSGVIRQALLAESDDGELRDVGAGLSSDAAGPLNMLSLAQNVSALAFDSLTFRKDTYRSVGGWPDASCREQAAHEFCRKLVSHGLRLVWSPFAEFATHRSVHGHASTGQTAALTPDEWHGPYRTWVRRG